ncbi:hypothetical protein [Paractinoplanes rishiriensis]|uniref:DUF3558 domain-containing protein n=1 Tax=Paractinoplanes rishiriensis TaxID=1050105 RepID=A0A919MU51_9ACTN|nr:hypothetical protein [Actinoplanes rishiriensis]GIE94974.1 hypothetical protein Ari01nite_24390 [Actinoplanes rishiriensis]
MSPRKLLPVLAMPVVALLLGALMSAPGNAGTSEPGSTPGSWTGGPICAEGTINAGPPTSDSPPRTPLFISIQPCAGTDPAVTAQARWGIAQYADTSAFVGILTNPFAAEGPTTRDTWNYTVDDLRAGHLGTIRAACLITDPHTRVACVRVVANSWSGTVEITPLPVDDPLVTRPATVLGMDNTIDPVCASCV